MFKLTLENPGKVLLDSHFEENPKPDFLRLYVRPGRGCSGSMLALKPDARGDRDLEMENNGYHFIMSRHLLEQLGEWAKIAANTKGGFIITAERAFTE